ncbi:MAG: Holliday junction branch migration protein RuvA [Phycisphaerales bacterium]|nr:Holliday junction branch migration protein RuvA [Phycisphaerales bacterium]
MIFFLQGEYAHKTMGRVVVNVHGVGYEVLISTQTYDAILHQDKGTLYCHLHITENSHLLYGFATLEEKELFLHLISVSGVGASTARLMLSGMPSGDIVQAIVHQQTNKLENIKGIGKKTAERLVLELKDKLSKWSSTINTSIPSNFNVQQDAVAALVNLGIPKPTAEKSVSLCLKENPDISIQDLIKIALQKI